MLGELDMDELGELVTQGQKIVDLLSFRSWLDAVALWLYGAFPNAGNVAEWLALDAGPIEGNRTANNQVFKDQLEDAVEKRIGWLRKLDIVTRPVAAALAEQFIPDDAEILLDGLKLFSVESAPQADERLTDWIFSVQRWLLENKADNESLSSWATLGASPFRLSDGILDSADAWSMYWDIVSRRYRWLAGLLSNSTTVENQYRRLFEIDTPASQSKINFEGPGYELIALLKEALQKEGGHSRFLLFSDDESIYEYAAFKFLLRGKEVTVKQLKKSVENKQYL